MGKSIIKARIIERKDIMVEREEVSDVLGRPRKKFLEWFRKVENLGVGKHEIEVAKRLIIGEYLFGEPEVAIVKNPEGRIFAVPEDKSLISKGRLVSRWDVRSGMKLRLTVDEEGIPEVLIL